MLFVFFVGIRLKKELLFSFGHLKAHNMHVSKLYYSLFMFWAHYLIMAT